MLRELILDMLNLAKKQELISDEIVARLETLSDREKSAIETVLATVSVFYASVVYSGVLTEEDFYDFVITQTFGVAGIAE